MKDDNIRNEKVFDQWHDDKIRVHQRKSIHVKPGQIWHCKVGINIGSETDGKGGFLRPVLVLGILGNMAFVAPLTTTVKDLSFYHEIIGIQSDPTIRSCVILSQVRSIDTRRLIKHKYTLDKEQLQETKKLFVSLLNK